MSDLSSFVIVFAFLYSSSHLLAPASVENSLWDREGLNVQPFNYKSTLCFCWAVESSFPNASRYKRSEWLIEMTPRLGSPISLSSNILDACCNILDRWTLARALLFGLIEGTKEGSSGRVELLRWNYVERRFLKNSWKWDWIFLPFSDVNSSWYSLGVEEQKLTGLTL